MEGEQTRRAVRRWYELLASGDLEGTYALCAPHFTWTGMGTSLPGGGRYDLDSWRRTVTSYASNMEHDPPPRITVSGFTVEGGRAAVEAETHGTTRRGLRYDQHYHMLFEVEEGRITAIREYQDTKLFYELFIAESD